MCGGIAFKINNISDSELERFYGTEKNAFIVKNGEIESRFWDNRPVLPVREGDEVRLYDWGNREKEVGLPLTGWSKIESIDNGKWDYLKPQIVAIPAVRGYEKGVWFDIDGSIEGIKISKEGKDRVYMITKPAGADYIKKTGHNREPKIVKSS